MCSSRATLYPNLNSHKSPILRVYLSFAPRTAALRIGEIWGVVKYAAAFARLAVLLTLSWPAAKRAAAQVCPEKSEQDTRSSEGEREREALSATTTHTAREIDS